MNITDVTKDAQLNAIIAGVSRRVEVDCGRTFGASNWIEYQTTGTGQTRAQIRNKPLVSLTSVRWGYQTAIQVSVTSANNDIWSAVQVMQDPLTSEKRCILTAMNAGGVTSTTTLSFTSASYQTCSQLVGGINGVSGFKATLLGNIDVPSRWLYPWTTSVKSYNTYFVQALGYPFIDLFGYVVDPLYGQIGFQPLSTMDYYFGPGLNVSFPKMFQGLCLDYRGGFEAIPDDIVLLANQLCADVHNSSKRDSNLNSESLADYSYTQTDPLLRRAFYADMLAPYRRIAIGGGGFA